MINWFKRKRLKKRRTRTLSGILMEQINFDNMVQRAERAGDTPNEKFLSTVREKLAEIRQKAENENNLDELDSLVEDAEAQAQLRAYVCPPADIQIEGRLAIDLIAEWKVPTSVIAELRNSLGKSLVNANKDSESARASLRAIFAELDSWSRYTDDCEDVLKKYTLWLGGFTLILPIIAATIYMWRPYLVIIGLICAGAAGSCASVMAKMPLLHVSLSGDLTAFLRRIVSRIGAGIAASLIGTALLGWGLLPLSIQNLTFAEALNDCTASPATSCTGVKTLVLLGIPMLLGFSERALTWGEQQIFGHARDRQGRPS
jgi:hypothetical protein